MMNGWNVPLPIPKLFQLVSIDNNNLMYKAFTATGQLYDEFILSKQEDGTNIYIDKAPEDVPEISTLPGRMRIRMSDEQVQQHQERFDSYKKRKKKW